MFLGRPRAWLGENPWYFGLKPYFYLQRAVLDRGVAFLDRDWDTLIILDACRYDLFEAVNTITGDLSRVVSLGSSTPEFLRRNFADTTHHDTVYVTANPQFAHHVEPGTFHAAKRLWIDDFDEAVGTVRPEAVVREARSAHEEFPNKRLIVHYMQPHYPFIGEFGQEIQESTRSGPFGIDGETYHSAWDRLEGGALTEADVWAAYRENLELTMPHVERLVDSLDGKTVITADHGNEFGRYGVYGHPNKLYMKNLVSVPWFEIDAESRRQVTEGGAAQRTATSDVEDKLEALGYR